MEVPLASSAEKDNRRRLLMKAIQQKDDKMVETLVDTLAGMNISEPELKATLPKEVHQVASTCMTTPLRISISYSNLHSMKYILNSPCIITISDKSLALQKILASSRLLQKEDMLQYVRLLLHHGAMVSNITHIATGLQNTFASDQTLFHELIRAFLDCGNNAHQGMLLLGFYLINRNPRPGSAARNISLDEWEDARRKCLNDIFLNGFDPYLFMKESHTYVNDNARLMQALPELLVMSTVVDNFTVAEILHRSAFYYPLVNIESKRIMRCLCQLLLNLGYNIGVITAKAPTQFNNSMGFTKAQNSFQLFSLQQLCRITIRNCINEPNMLLGIDQLKLPSRLGSFCLMSDLNPTVELYQKGIK